MSSQTPSFREDILGIPNSTASPKDSALVIIDAQNEYALGKLKVSNVASSRKAIASLLEKYRANGGTRSIVYPSLATRSLCLRVALTALKHMPRKSNFNIL